MKYLSDYQTFENKQQLNEAVSDHLSSHTYDLNDTARDVLLMLARYSVKFPGVAHLKTATIADSIGATIADSIGKSGRTIRRAIASLVDLGIVEKIPFMREVSGGYGANLYRIMPYDVQSNMSTREDVVETTRASEETVENENEPISSLNLNNIITNTYLRPFYARFKAFIHSTIGEGSQPLISRLYGVYFQPLISRLYGVYLSHSKPLLAGNAFDKGSVEHIGFQALKTAVMATKNKRIKNLAGYFNGVYGVLDRMLDKLYFGEMDGVGGLHAM
ncbi:hypothetical protein ACA29_17185 [Lederbergia galactosidilytica]|uniref:Helix-turn-helix domain-containing protein n=1 Tax=Lederbergia galactosidilytica TaxID=217031 RepID=A0A0Q9Y3X3_9BACI|nr:hypothetical protein ACA29_17185 [Lederbergia galactosidilytica]